MARRIVVEEPCRDGEYEAHYLTRAQIEVREAEGAYIDEMGDPACDGGSRRVLDPGSYVLIEKDGNGRGWPLDPQARRILTAAAAFGHPEGASVLWHEVLDALVGGEQP